MSPPLIDLRHHGKAGWTWAVHHPGRVSVWRTDETGHGLRQLVAGPNSPAEQPDYIWVDRDPAGAVALPADRAVVLARLRVAFEAADPGPHRFPVSSAQRYPIVSVP